MYYVFNVVLNNWTLDRVWYICVLEEVSRVLPVYEFIEYSIGVGRQSIL